MEKIWEDDEQLKQIIKDNEKQLFEIYKQHIEYNNNRNNEFLNFMKMVKGDIPKRHRIHLRGYCHRHILINDQQNYNEMYTETKKRINEYIEVR